MLRRLKTVPKMSLASLLARLMARAPLACCCAAVGLLPPGAVGGGAACEGGSHFLV